MVNRYTIKKIELAEVIEAMNLVWEVFTEFEAPMYEKEGIDEFRSYIQVDSIQQKIKDHELFVWGSFDYNQLVGVIATRRPCHISLLFVKKSYHRRGIARILFDTALNFHQELNEEKVMSVNSSPYALEVYKHLGFKASGDVQTMNGITFIPMKRKLTYKNVVG